MGMLLVVISAFVTGSLCVLLGSFRRFAIVCGVLTVAIVLLDLHMYYSIGFSILSGLVFVAASALSFFVTALVAAMTAYGRISTRDPSVGGATDTEVSLATLLRLA